MVVVAHTLTPRERPLHKPCLRWPKAAGREAARVPHRHQLSQQRPIQVLQLQWRSGGSRRQGAGGPGWLARHGGRRTGGGGVAAGQAEGGGGGGRASLARARPAAPAKDCMAGGCGCGGGRRLRRPRSLGRAGAPAPPRVPGPPGPPPRVPLPPPPPPPAPVHPGWLEHMYPRSSTSAPLVSNRLISQTGWNRCNMYISLSLSL